MAATTKIPVVIACILSFAICQNWLPAVAQSTPNDSATNSTDRTASDTTSTPCPFSADNYHAVWHLIAQNTLYKERLTDWEQWEHRFDDQLNSKSQTDEAISNLVTALGDEYTYLSSPEETFLHKHARTRDHVVEARMLPYNIGYVRISTFWSGRAAAEVQTALRMLESANGYVLDLRDNKGGDIYEAQRACAMFLNKGTFSTLTGRCNGRASTEKLEITPTKLRFTTNKVVETEDRVPNLTGKRRLLILVNRNTRSAAEMMAGCLRDNHRGLLMGERTYGKGVVQSSWVLPDGSSIKIAVAKHYLPSGKNIHGCGIQPDICVKNWDSNDLQLAKTVDCLQRSGGIGFAVHTAYSR